MYGKIIREFAPNEKNNRNSEATFLKLKNGDIMCAYARYGDQGSGDHCKADIYAVVSDDQGESFGKEFLILSCEEVGGDNVMSPAFIRLKNDAMGLFYLKKNIEKESGICNCVPYLAISEDEGKTWSEHIRCIEEDGYFVLVNDRVVGLENGRLIMPIAKHEMVNGRVSIGIVYMYVSDDDGRTWRETSGGIKLQGVGKNPDLPEWHLSQNDSSLEPGVVQFKDGKIWCFIRTMLERQYECFSEDNGETWSTPYPSSFTSQRSPMSARRLSNGKTIVLWNPVPTYNGSSRSVDGVWTGGRTPLTCVLLDENRKRITNFVNLETEQKAGFCYTAIHEIDDGDVLLAYCAGGVPDGTCLARLRVRKLYKSELEKLIIS